MYTFLLALDRQLIQLYRMTGNPVADYLIGTFALALISVALGEASVLVLRRVNLSHMEKLDREMSEKHSLSMEAKRRGDSPAYEALNREANDAFGRVFFNMFTFSAASLWPAFLALSWMQTRFIGIEFPVPFSIPLLGDAVGYVFTFIALYVLARILAGSIRGLLSSQNERMREQKKSAHDMEG